MKALQCFDDVLARDVEDYFERQGVVRQPEIGERMDLHAIDMDCAYRIPSTLPRRASYAERLAEWEANKLDGLPADLW